MKYGTDRAASPEAHTIETSRNPSRAVHRFRGSRLRLVQASVSGKFGRTHPELKLSAMVKSYANYHVPDVSLKAVFVRGGVYLVSGTDGSSTKKPRAVRARKNGQAGYEISEGNPALGGATHTERIEYRPDKSNSGVTTRQKASAVEPQKPFRALLKTSPRSSRRER